MSNRNRKKTTDVTTTLYELNKVNMNQISPVDKEWLEEKIKDITNSFILFSTSNYWMLLCRERYDYTVFSRKNTITTCFAQELLGCLTDRGDILDLSEQPDGAYEIWIRDRQSGENFAYYLFDYSYGVIEV